MFSFVDGLKHRYLLDRTEKIAESEFDLLYELGLAAFWDNHRQLNIVADPAHWHIYTYWWRSQSWMAFSFEETEYTYHRWRQRMTIPPTDHMGMVICFLRGMTWPVIRNGNYDRYQWDFLSYIHDINLMALEHRVECFSYVPAC